MKKLTDREVNAALVAYWKRLAPEDDITVNYGHRVEVVRKLIKYFVAQLLKVDRALSRNDAKALRRALERMRKRVGKSEEVLLEDARDDAWDIVEALEARR